MLLASGLIYECGDETNGEFKKYGSKGYCIYDLSYIHNSPAELIILSSSSSDTSNLLNNTPFIHLSTGKATNIGITSTGHTYSWGDGELGELGLGAGNRKTSCPMQMKSMEEAVSCSSGTNHSLLIDRHGRLFAWGGNKSCQLGLHASWKVEAFDDVNKNDFFEEIFLFVPRLIPTSLKNPALQVACGDEFSVILTVEGRLWTCGSNQCGQLGRGNISRRERLAELNSPEQKFVSIAAGSYHAVAATAKSIFCWGLNTLGQVGTDDGSCKSFSTPTLVYTAEGGDQIVQVYASKHSSAARLSSGRLLTWGDGRHHRLLQDDTHTVWKPTLVERLLNEKICRFLFTPTGAAFCSESFVTKVNFSCSMFILNYIYRALLLFLCLDISCRDTSWL